MDRCPAPGCNRAGPSVGNCGETILCPNKTVPVDPAKDVTVHCRLCDKTLSVPLTDLMKKKSPPLRCTSDREVCQAVVVLKVK